jgi:acyl carrier protein
MTIEKQIREYIMENIMFTNDPAALSNDDSFLNKGIIDSTGILEVSFFIEQQFGIKISDKELLPENLDSVNNIARFIQKKQNGG